MPSNHLQCNYRKLYVCNNFLALTVVDCNYPVLKHKGS